MSKRGYLFCWYCVRVDAFILSGAASPMLIQDGSSSPTYVLLALTNSLSNDLSVALHNGVLVSFYYTTECDAFYWLCIHENIDHIIGIIMIAI